MYDKIYVVSGIYVIYKSLGLVVPSLSIADKRKPETALSVQSLLDTGHIAGIDAGVARYPGIVRTALQQVTRRNRQQQKQPDYIPASILR